MSGGVIVLSHVTVVGDLIKRDVQTARYEWSVKVI
jgi:hypothetical protein